MKVKKNFPVQVIGAVIISTLLSGGQRLPKERETNKRLAEASKRRSNAIQNGIQTSDCVQSLCRTALFKRWTTLEQLSCKIEVDPRLIVTPHNSDEFVYH